MGYPSTVFTNHITVKYTFKGRKLSDRLARWYLTIEEFALQFKFVLGRANVAVDALSENVSIVAVTPVPNFSLYERDGEQRKHVV